MLSLGTIVIISLGFVLGVGAIVGLLHSGRSWLDRRRLARCRLADIQQRVAQVRARTARQVANGVVPLSGEVPTELFMSFFVESPTQPMRGRWPALPESAFRIGGHVRHTAEDGSLYRSLPLDKD